MGVASDPDLGQVHEGDIAAIAVHDVPVPPGHFEKNAPLLLAWIHARLVGNVVAVIDDDGYLREQHEIRLGHGDRAERSVAEGHGRRHIPLGEWKVEARLFLMAVRQPSPPVGASRPATTPIPQLRVDTLQKG